MNFTENIRQFIPSICSIAKNIWDILEKKNFTGRPKSVVSSTSFGGGRKLGKIKLISSYKTRRALQAGTAKLILILEGQNNLLEFLLIIIQGKCNLDICDLLA